MIGLRPFYSIAIISNIFAVCSKAQEITSSAREISPSQITQENRNAIVYLKITGADENGVPIEAEATGFLVSSEGHVLTARHITQTEEGQRFLQVRVEGAPTSRFSFLQPLDILDESVAADLMLLKFRGNQTYEIVSVCDEAMTQLSIGDDLVALGFPLGSEQSLINGVLSNKSAEGGLYQTNVDFVGGYSGGPVFDEEFGSVVGVVTSGTHGVAGRNFFTPIQRGRNLLNQLTELPSCRIKDPINDVVKSIDDADELQPDIGDILSADPDDPEAQFDVGDIYFDGDGVVQDYDEAARWFRRAADQGNAPAQTRLGYMYYHGLGVTQDYAEAVRWWRLAAAQGFARAQTNLAQSYRLGHGVPKDYVESIRWYRLAVEQNYAAAQNGLGYMYENGLGVSQSYSEALRWYQRAADQGDRSAQNNLGYMYYHGIGVSEDSAEGVRWWSLAAAQGHTGAQNSLGKLSEEGQEGVVQDYRQAAEWYQQAAERGDATGQWNLGRLYADGLGVPNDSARAAQLFLSALEQDEASAQDELIEQEGIHLSDSVRREIQSILKSESFYSEEIDGSFGPSTLSALHGFMARN